MEWYFYVLIALATFLFMDVVAWFTHKYVMHGFLWILHKDHHMLQKKRFEWNDLFALMFAVPSIILIITGSLSGMDLKFWLGIGIALYGIAYFLLHDVLVHRRLHLLDNANNWYFRGIIAAHSDHHSGRANYGFILVIPWRYFNVKERIEPKY